MKSIRNLLIVSLLTFACLFVPAYSQPEGHETLLSESQLQNEKWYYSLEEALVDPDNVYKLSLKDFKMKTVPAEIGQLKNLQVLTINNCKMKKIPAEIGECKKIQRISFYDNSIKFLPVEMKELHQLEILYLGKNKLMNLPNWVAGLNHLRRLDIGLNRITPLELNYIRNMLPNVDVSF